MIYFKFYRYGSDHFWILGVKNNGILKLGWNRRNIYIRDAIILTGEACLFHDNLGPSFLPKQSDTAKATPQYPCTSCELHSINFPNTACLKNICLNQIVWDLPIWVPNPSEMTKVASGTGQGVSFNAAHRENSNLNLKTRDFTVLKRPIWLIILWKIWVICEISLYQ